MVNLLLIGPITRDKNIFNNKSESSIGGAVYYESYVLENLESDYTIVTALSKDDEYLLNNFPNEDRIIPVFKDETLIFINEYLNDSNRIQKSNFAEIPITLKDFKNLNIDLKDYDGILINPLLLSDVDLDLLEYLSGFDLPIFFSIQGILRDYSLNGYVKKSMPDKFGEILKYVNVLFLDEFEAEFIYGGSLDLIDTVKNLSTLGPNEVIVTENSKGSLIYNRYEKRLYDIEACPAGKISSPTGAGDTYMAAYIVKRLNKSNIYESGQFASIVSTLKLENNGPFKDSILDVLDRLLDTLGF
jgi:hypothetical protein